MSNVIQFPTHRTQAAIEAIEAAVLSTGVAVFAAAVAERAAEVAEAAAPTPEPAPPAPYVSPRYIDTADVAKMVRKALKVFGHKFSVRSSRYAGGSSIRVNWVDGPTGDAVEAVAGHFHGATFDGMTDMKSNHTSQLDGEAVRYGNCFIFFSRTFTPEAYGAALQATADEYTEGVIPEDINVRPACKHIGSGLEGHGTDDSPLGNVGRYDTHWSWSALVRRQAAETTF